MIWIVTCVFRELEKNECNYVFGGLYLPFWLLRLCNRFCFSFVSLLLFCNLIISDKNMFVNKKIDKM